MFKNFKFKLKYVNFRLIILVLSLVSLGIVVIGSAVPGAGYQSKQIIGAVAGMVIMMILMVMDYHYILKLHWIIYGFTIIILAMVLISGTEVKGATRWIRITDTISIQPSEFAKIMLILFWAWFLGNYGELMKKWKGFFIITGLTAIPLFLIVAEPDLSTTILTIMLFITALFVSGFSYKKFGVLLAFFIPLITAAVIYLVLVPPPKNILLKEYQYKRIMAFINPDEYADDRYQQDNAVMAIGSGQLNGKGLYNDSANSVKNGNNIAEPQTDFIFAIIGEELGFVGCVITLVLMALIMLECVITGARAPDMSGRIICFGVAAIFTFQTFINIGVVTEILPNTGIPLPFVSYGLSSLISMFSGIGLVLSVRFRKKAILEENTNEHRFNRT